MKARPLAQRGLVALLCVLGIVGCSTSERQEARAHYQLERVAASLNALRNDICAEYGFRNGAPRVNLGPCGRFARDFRERWNARFHEPVEIAFIIANNDPANCFHVLIRLPDGNFFDGGSGVMTEAFLKALNPNGRIETMTRFDYTTLDKRSYGLGRSYPECPNYSDKFTRRAIDTRLLQAANSCQ